MLKKEEIAKLKNASKDELAAKLLELKKELMNTRFQLTSGQLKDTTSVKKIRRNIAVIKTFVAASAESDASAKS